MNLVVMLTFRQSKTQSTFEISLAAVMFSAISAIPLFMAKVLWTNKKSLHEESNFKIYGNLYLGKKIDSEK